MGLDEGVVGGRVDGRAPLISPEKSLRRLF